MREDTGLAFTESSSKPIKDKRESPSHLRVGGMGVTQLFIEAEYLTWHKAMKLDAQFYEDGNDRWENPRIFEKQTSGLGISFFILPDFKNAGGGSCTKWNSCAPMKKAGKSSSFVTSLKNKAQTVSDWSHKTKDNFISF